MYNEDFSFDYDRYVNWTNRLAFEMPFLEAQLQRVSAPGAPARVLDAATGTGMHAIALAQRGYPTAGADLSADMVAQSRRNSAAAGVDVAFSPAGFGELSRAFGIASGQAAPFDAVLCLGNSLVHVLSAPALVLALADFATCLRSGGLLITQSRNFDKILENQERWMLPESAVEDSAEGNREWLFLRFYDFRPDGLLNFHFWTLQRQQGESWQQRLDSTLLWPQRQDELLDAAERAGFGDIKVYGSLGGEPFDPLASGNLVVVAQKK